MRGWVPHDDGALALTAERVLKGDVPHRDFQDLYTGGLAYYHALAFKLLGVRLTSLRWAVFLFFLTWIPVVFLVARRFAGAVAAAGITILAAAWSLPNYSAAMPSWYNLFFATLGAWTAFRFLETGSRWWLFGAGIFGGASVCVKVSGLYYIAALLLFLVYCEQHEDSVRADSTSKPIFFPAALGASMLSFVYLLFRLLGTLGSPLFVFNFVLPGAALAGAIVWREVASAHSDFLTRGRTLMRMIVPFAAGVVVPCSILLIPYWTSHSVGNLIQGALIAPQARLAFAGGDISPPANAFSYLALVVLMIVVAAAVVWRSVPRLVPPIAGLTLFIVILATRDYVILYQVVWFAVSHLIPLCVLLGCGWLEFSRRRGTIDAASSAKIFLLLAAAGFCSLVQFPYAHPIYFVYVAPLLWLVLAALTSIKRDAAGLPLALGVAALLYVAVRVTPGFIFIMAFGYQTDVQTYELHLDRAAGLRVDPITGPMYEQLVSFVQEHSSEGKLYAGPDSPQIYFLAGKPNPTGVLFDFLDKSKEPLAKSALEDPTNSVVVIRDHPEFSPPLDPAMREFLWQRYGHAKEFGFFTVYWR